MLDDQVMRVICVSMVVLLSACGAEAGGFAPAAGGSAGGSTGGSTGGSAGSSTSGGSGGGGSGPAPGGCASPFGASSPVFVGAMNEIPGGLSVTSDNLELFYQAGGRFVVRKRAAVTEPLGEEIVLSELAGVCTVDQNPSWDMSSDGLRMYINCVDMTATLFMAERQDKNSPFVPASATAGVSGASMTISTDELTMYSTTSNAAGTQLLKSVRTSTSEPFGAPVPDTDITGEFRHPELSSDGLALFGVVSIPSPDLAEMVEWRLAVASRATVDAPFGSPVMTGMPVPANPTESDYTPTVTAACGSMYFTRVGELPNGMGNLATVHVAGH